MGAIANLWFAIFWAFLCGVNLASLTMPYNFIVAILNAAVALMAAAPVTLALKRIPRT